MFGNIVPKLRAWREKHLSAGTAKWISFAVHEAAMLKLEAV